MDGVIVGPPGSEMWGLGGVYTGDVILAPALWGMLNRARVLSTDPGRGRATVDYLDPMHKKDEPRIVDLTSCYTMVSCRYGLPWCSTGVLCFHTGVGNCL